MIYQGLAQKLNLKTISNSLGKEKRNFSRGPRDMAHVRPAHVETAHGEKIPRASTTLQKKPRTSPESQLSPNTISHLSILLT